MAGLGIAPPALEHEVLSRHHFTTKAQARSVVLAWCHEFYNTARRHSSAAMMTPADYEHTAAQPRRPQGGGLMSTPTPPGDVSVTPPTCPCLLYTSPSPRDRQKSRMPSSA